MNGREEMARKQSERQDAKSGGIGRRGFFGAALGAASVAALATGGARPALAQSGDERTRARYQETEHVLKFYETNRYYRGE
jgi:hypothetical protein